MTVLLTDEDVFHFLSSFLNIHSHLVAFPLQLKVYCCHHVVLLWSPLIACGNIITGIVVRSCKQEEVVC